MLPLDKVHHPKPGWYRGDFHLHTTASDGHYSPSTLARLAKAEGLDFLAITDHNTIASFGQFGDDSDLLVIPGIEITLAEGHWNVFGIGNQPDWLAEVCVWNKPLSQKDLSCSITDFMAQIAAQGMLNSINHPLLRPWEWQDGTVQLQYMHCLEIWNDPDWPDNAQGNPAAVQMWTRWLDAGYRITAIGGSDFHFLAGEVAGYPGERPGRPTTYVYAQELSSKAILEALRGGHAYVSMGPQVNLMASCAGKIGTIGTDFGAVQGKLDFKISIAGAPVGACAKLIRNGVDLGLFPLQEGQSTFELAEVISDQPTWYRLDVEDSAGEMLLVTNPVYTGPRPLTGSETFVDLMFG
ncbi:MAG: CehA/McbA family metallohydrolase [Anaerolineales bacterium]|jgi:hypothetical protein